MKNLDIGWLEILLFLALFAQGGYYLWRGTWSELFVVVVAVGLSAVPYVLSNYYEFKSNEFIRVGIVLFTICTLVFGELYKLYSVFSWWDTFLHISAGAGLALVGYSWLLSLVRQEQVASYPIFHTLFVASGTSLVLVLWEVYEFCIDQLGWSANLMQPSLFDTMIDLIVGLGGMAFVCVGGYILLSKQKLHAVKKMTAHD